MCMCVCVCVYKTSLSVNLLVVPHCFFYFKKYLIYLFMVGLGPHCTIRLLIVVVSLVVAQGL